MNAGRANLSPRPAGLLLALLQGGLLLSLGGVMLADRARLPRAWVRTAPYDPELPIRGRYVSLQLLVPAGELGSALSLQTPPWGNGLDVQLVPRGRRLEAIRAQPGQAWTHLHRARIEQRDGAVVARLDQPVAYFIPPEVDDPSRRPGGEELWVEVTLPPEGPPRPIRLGIRRLQSTGADAAIEPLRLSRSGS
jgi:hypothetical protein